MLSFGPYICLVIFVMSKSNLKERNHWKTVLDEKVSIYLFRTTLYMATQSHELRW